MVFINLFDKYTSFYPIMVQFEANRCVCSIKNMNCCILCLSPSQILTCLNYRSKVCSFPRYAISSDCLSMKNIFSCHVDFCMILKPSEVLPPIPLTKGYSPPHLAIKPDTYVAGTHRTTKYDENPWPDKDNKR